MAVHVVERDGNDADEWIVIDQIAHGDDDHEHDEEDEHDEEHEHQEAGHCNDVYTGSSGYTDSATGEE